MKNNIPFKTQKEAFNFMIIYWKDISRIINVVQNKPEVFDAHSGDNTLKKAADLLEKLFGTE